MKKKTEAQRNFSAYCFALILTASLCFFAAGVIYIDSCARNTLLSAEGMFYPFLDQIIDATEKIFRFHL